MSRIKAVFLLLFLALGTSALLAQEADLGVQKLGPGEALDDSDVAYTVTVFNAGPGDAQTVLLSDPVPPGMSFVSATQEDGPAFSCDTAVDCTIATFPAGASATFTFVFHIEEGTEFLNVATISSQTFDPNDENNSGVAFTSAAPPQADLGVSKSADRSSTAPDTDVTFFLTLTNNGPAAAENVTLTDVLPGTMTFVSFTQTSGPPMTCDTTTCTAATFPASATATFELTGHVPADTPSGTEFTNTASVASDDDPFEENNVATTTVTISSTDLRIAKSGPASAVAGTTVTYEITVTNDGPDPALNAGVSDPQICPVVNCAIGVLASGASAVLSGEVTIPSNATSWSNTATVSDDSTFDPDESDNSATVTTIITQSADLRVVKSAPATVVASTNLTYTITVTNDGPSDASNVVVTDTLPPGTTFVSSSCGANPCAAGTLAAGASEVITLVVNVAAGTAGPLVNEAAVTSSTPDPAPGNNTSTFETAVTPAPADLSITKSAGYDELPVGSTVTYTIVVTNQGPGVANDVVVTDQLPPGTTLVSSSAGCSGTTTVTCSVGTLAAGSSATIELVVTLPSTPGPVSNTAAVTTSSPDPGAGNNAATVVIEAHLPFESIPTLSPAGLAFLALTIASIVLVVLRRAF
jgi:uncharacterized repeat protein (TIGR01451 family)